MLIVQRKDRGTLNSWTDCDCDGFETIEAACRFGIENLLDADKANYGQVWRVVRMTAEVVPFATPTAW